MSMLHCSPNNITYHPVKALIEVFLTERDDFKADVFTFPVLASTARWARVNKITNDDHPKSLLILWDSVPQICAGDYITVIVGLIAVKYQIVFQHVEVITICIPTTKRNCSSKYVPCDIF